MTYLLGINQFDINALICDTRVTWWRSNKVVRGTNTSLKSGLFFPGCIYGITGNLENARNFIIECKQKLTGHNTLFGFWEKFLHFAALYHYPKNLDNHFELLLSSRNLGKPRFYVLNSSSASVKLKQSPVSLGSGENILKPFIQNLVSKNTPFINDLIQKTKMPHFTFPFLYCLWLNELTQGMDLPTLEKYYVGGIFHFLWQDSQTDSAQYPAVYVLNAADVDKKFIYSWFYRVAYAQGALVVDNPITNAREIFTDFAARPNWQFMDYDKLKNSINSEVDSQPFYYFCGFGFTDPKNRGEYGITVTTENKFIVDKKGWMDPRWKQLLQDKFSRDYQLKIADKST